MQPTASKCLILLALGGFVPGCSGPAETDPERPRNLLLISIDTCRADRVGPYRADGRTDVTPNIDAVASSGVVFERALSPAPTTLPAHASMLTGTIPPYHGVHDNGETLAGPANRTLAEILGEAGRTTAAFVGSVVLDASLGIDQGFDSFDPRLERRRGADRVLERRAEHVSDAALKWLDRNGDESFFLFLHYYDPHQRYDPPEPFASRFHGDPYTGEIAYTDAQIGRVLARLDDLGLAESTLVVITSDHGEMLGEHGEQTHSYFVYESAIRVPLVFRGPGLPAGARVGGMTANLVDVVPTVCGLLGVSAPDGLDGVDLSDALRGREGAARNDRLHYAEATEPAKYGSNPLLAVIGGGLKYIESTRPELYDTLADPAETTNLVTDRPERAGELRAGLVDLLERRERRPDAASAPDAATLERLRSLGYVEAGAGPAFLEVDPGRPDAKDLLAFHVLNNEVPMLIWQGAHDEARSRAQRMLRERPDFHGGHRYLGEIALAEDRPDDALRHFEDAAARLPGNASLIRLRADALYRIGLARQTAGRAVEAVERYRDAIDLDPDHVEARTNLADLLAAGGSLDEAIGMYERALASAPGRAEIHRRLGVALAYRGRADDALAAYRKAVERSPNSFEIRSELGELLLRAGRKEEAAEHLRRAAELKPDDPAARRRLERALSD